MPQFDVFIFFSSIFYLLTIFFSLMFYNQFAFLPRISAVLKLREKLFKTKNESIEVIKDIKLYKISENIS